MALHVQLPELPRSRDVTQPVQPRLDCTIHESRQANDYVRTPCHSTPPNSHRVLMEPKRVQYHVQASETVPSTPETEIRTQEIKDPDPQLPSKQNGSGSHAGSSRCGAGSSSICPRCRRCRCEKCRARRELPRSWCGTWECSGESTMDCVTCMCCIRGTFYHCCSDAEEEANYSDNPCGCCDYPRCLARWLFIIVVALFLPCLVLYWPFRGALALLTDCYNDCGPGGCRCNLQHSSTRPLIEAENCSA